MKLYVMRHGIADEAAASLHDFDRALTQKGRKRVRDVAKALASHDEAPALIITSPLVRAVQTAEIVAAVLDPEEPVGVRQEIAPGGSALTLVSELLTNGPKTVMLVSHEPTCSELVRQLVGEEGFSQAFLKAMVVGIRLDLESKAKVRFILNPKTLALSGPRDPS